jgi:DNA-binding YbaB/EbfC family protein
MANRMLQQAQQAEASLVNERVEAASGGGAVKVVANGKGEIMEIAIAKEVVDPDDIDMLQELILAAIREAVSKANELQTAKLKGVIPSGILPGF